MYKQLSSVHGLSVLIINWLKLVTEVSRPLIVGSSWSSDRAVTSQSSFMSFSGKNTVLQGNYCTAGRKNISSNAGAREIFHVIIFWCCLCVQVTVLATTNRYGRETGKAKNIIIMSSLLFSQSLGPCADNYGWSLALEVLFEWGCFWCVSIKS